MSALRAFASLLLAGLLGSGVALAQTDPRNESTKPDTGADTTVVTPHAQGTSAQPADQPAASGTSTKDQIEQSEKDNPHSRLNRNREVSGHADVDAAETHNPHHVRHKDRTDADIKSDAAAMPGERAGMAHSQHMAEGKADASSVLERLNVADQGEIEMGKLAQQNGSSRIQEYGRMLEEDHQKSMQQVKELAQKKGVTLSSQPKDMMARHGMQDAQKMKQHLQSMHGKDFDQAFARMMFEEHQKDINHLKSWRSSVGDKDVTALIDQTLPVLERHLSTAKQLKQPAAQGRSPDQR